MSRPGHLILKIAVLLSPVELRERKREEYLADFRDAALCGIPERQVACGALGASLRARTKAIQRKLAATESTERKKHMKAALSSLGAAALLAAAGLGVSLPATSASPSVTHLTNDEMQKNVGWTDISTLNISNEPATSMPIGQP